MIQGSCRTEVGCIDTVWEKYTHLLCIFVGVISGPALHRPSAQGT